MDRHGGILTQASNILIRTKKPQQNGRGTIREQDWPKNQCFQRGPLFALLVTAT
jgi:hypothetical protein